MSRVKIEFNIDNAAFDEDDCGPEIARVLRTLAEGFRSANKEELRSGGSSIRDINGNTIGRVIVEIDGYDA